MEKNLVILFYPKTEPTNINKMAPLAPLKVGSELKHSGYSVVVIDERFEEEYREKLRNLLSDAIWFGVSAMTGYQIHGGLKASSFVKREYPDIPIVWGGWHASILPSETLENSVIDIVAKGQGEEIACRLSGAIRAGRPLNGVKGISYKDKGRIIDGGENEWKDVNDFCDPDASVIDIKRYVSQGPLGEKTIFWNSSQGCPFRCGFCSTPTVFCRRWSGLKAERLLRQIERLVSDYQIDGITFADDNFFVDMGRIEGFCRGLLHAGIKIKWATDVRVDQINRFSDDFCRLLKESGCSSLFVGAESGDEEVLKLVDKKITVGDTYKAAEKLARHKIISDFFMVVGFPENPDKELDETLRLIRNIKSSYPDHQVTPFLYTPYPGTPLLELALKKGLKVPDRLEGWVNWNILSVTTPWVDKGYLDKVKMYAKFYYPLAYPSHLLRKKFRSRLKGIPYRVLSAIAKFRVKNNFFFFPLEWRLVKIFRNLLKNRFGWFKNMESFR